MGLLSWLSRPHNSSCSDEELHTEKTQMILSTSTKVAIEYGSSDRDSEDSDSKEYSNEDSFCTNYEPLALDSPSPTLWERYNFALEKRPVVVKSITGFLILGSGDLCGQGIEALLALHDTNDAAVRGIDWPRASRFAAFGLFGAPWSHYYFYFLDHFLPPTANPLTKTTLIKVCIDQGIQAPILLAMMISILSLLKGNGFNGVRLDMSLNYWNSLLANWKLWIPASFVNLAFVIPALRVLFVNVVFFVWTIILSMMINGS